MNTTSDFLMKFVEDAKKKQLQPYTSAIQDVVFFMKTAHSLPADSAVRMHLHSMIHDLAKKPLSYTG